MRLLKKVFSEFVADDCMTMSAALAYYALFALPSLLLVIVSVAGLALGHSAAQGDIQARITSIIGSGAGKQIGDIVQNASQHSSSSLVATALGFLALLFGATSAFAQLQTALNTIWHVEPDPNNTGVKNFLKTRIVSFMMVVGIAIVMLASLALSSVLANARSMVAGLLPSMISQPAMHVIGFIVSFIVIGLLIAAVFKALPDAELSWKQVRRGAMITSLLFTVGQYLIGLYLGKSGAGSVYGAAGSLVLVVLWIYYSALILLFGAELTRVFEESRGHAIVPKKGAVREVRQPEPSNPGPSNPRGGGSPVPLKGQ